MIRPTLTEIGSASSIYQSLGHVTQFCTQPDV